MRIIARSTLKKYWQRKPDAEEPLRAWYAEAKAGQWNTPADIKAKHGSASMLRNSRVVFNIGGNKYRLIVRINYEFHIVYIRFIGTHKEYDAIKAEDI